jgi:ribonuclease T2
MVLVLVGAGAAHADVKMSGTFVADSACPATQAIKNGKNPGNISTETGKSYELLAGNKDEPTHYLIQVPGADPERRWVNISCGHVSGGSAANTPAPGGQAKPQASGKPEYVFALSWQPAFCETKASKPECKAQNPTEFDASHFTLHGLWPQPNGNFYCQVPASDKANDNPSHWGDLPPVKLDANTRAELDEVMPGTASMLERHEWIKHGTCYGKSQQEYFSDALNLTRAVNASAVRDLFTKNVGQATDLGPDPQRLQRGLRRRRRGPRARLLPGRPIERPAPDRRDHARPVRPDRPRQQARRPPDCFGADGQGRLPEGHGRRDRIPVEGSSLVDRREKLLTDLDRRTGGANPGMRPRSAVGAPKAIAVRRFIAYIAPNPHSP